MTTSTTGEAMALLRARRKAQIADGKRVARLLAEHNDGEVTSAMVMDYMKEHGFLDPEIKGFWVGAVFHNNGEFEDTGKMVTPKEARGRAHAPRAVRVWRLKGGPPLPIPTTPPRNGRQGDLFH